MEQSSSAPADGDQAARFAILMMENKEALNRYLLSLHPWIDEVDDLMQNTAMTLWKKIDEYDTAREFLPWALRVAYFEVLSWRKHMRKRRFVFSEELVEQLSATQMGSEDLDHLRHEALQDCLEKLPDHHRDIVEQRYGKRGTLKELAAETGVSVHKIYHRLEAARSSLADCVQRGLMAMGYEFRGGPGR